MSNMLKPNSKKKYTIKIPEQRLSIFETEVNSKYAIVVRNDALLDLDEIQKAVFGWSCKVEIVYLNCDKNNFPLKDDREDSSDFIDAIDVGIKAGDHVPNGVFLGKVINDGKCIAIWQVNKPELAAEYLDKVIESGNYPAGGIEYDIECDLSWSNVQFFLQDFKSERR